MCRKLAKGEGNLGPDAAGLGKKLVSGQPHTENEKVRMERGGRVFPGAWLPDTCGFGVGMLGGLGVYV